MSEGDAPMKLNYFDTGVEIKGGCYHEFVKGKWDGKTFWRDDYLMLDDDILNGLNIADLFCSVIPAYDPCGPTEFTWTQWEQIQTKAAETGGETEQVIQELNAWLGAPSGTEIAFTSLGV